MKKFLVPTVALAMAACSTTPQNPSDYKRDPANMSQDSQGSVSASANLIGQVSMSTVQASAQGVRVVGESTSALARISGDWAVEGVGVSRDAGTIVFRAATSAATSASNTTSKAVTFIVTSTGKVIQVSARGTHSALNNAKSAVSVVVDNVQEVSGVASDVVANVWDSSRSVIIGTVRASGSASSKVWDMSKSGSRVAMDASGNLLNASGDVIGQVWDSSKHTVSFVVDASGKILSFSADKSIMIMHSTSDVVRDFASHTWTGLKSAGTYSVNVSKASVKGSALVLNASGKSVVVVSDAVGGFFQETY